MGFRPVVVCVSSSCLSSVFPLMCRSRARPRLSGGGKPNRARCSLGARVEKSPSVRVVQRRRAASLSCLVVVLRRVFLIFFFSSSLRLRLCLLLHCVARAAQPKRERGEEAEGEGVGGFGEEKKGTPPRPQLADTASTRTGLGGSGRKGRKERGEGKREEEGWGENEEREQTALAPRADNGAGGSLRNRRFFPLTLASRPQPRRPLRRTRRPVAKDAAAWHAADPSRRGTAPPTMPRR